MLTYKGILDALRRAPDTEVRGLKTKEIICCDLFLGHGQMLDADFITYDGRSFDQIQKYLYGEFSWYMSGSRNVADISKYSKFWENIQNKDGTVNSNYGYLVFYTNQFAWSFYQLETDMNTRQAVILYNDKEYYYSGNKDFICTQLQQFFIRDNKLVSQVYIRSSDAIFGLTYDIPWWRFVQQQMLLKLKQTAYPDLELGFMKVCFGSLHIYENKYHLLDPQNIRGYKIDLQEVVPLDMSMEWYEKNLQKMLYIREIS